jgi:hypothetical protein
MAPPYAGAASPCSPYGVWLRAVAVGSDISGHDSIGFKRSDDRSIRMDALD